MGAAILVASVHAGDSMVCGKPSIRETLKVPYKNVHEQKWASIQKTVEEQVEVMARDVERAEQDLVHLEEQAAKKGAESSPGSLDEAAVKNLINSAFGGDDNFADAAQAIKYDCGSGADIPEDQSEFFFNAYDTALEKFAEAAGTALRDAGKMYDQDDFVALCEEQLPTDTCMGLCGDMGDTLSENNAVSAITLGSPTHEELLVLIAAKKTEIVAAKATHEECSKSVATITRLRKQYVENTAVVKTASKSVSRTRRTLRQQENLLKKVIKAFNIAVEEDTKARKALEEARILKEEAAENLRMWEAHMKALLVSIEKQKEIVRRTEESLRAAEHASRVVIEFKNRLSTALTALVSYYDEAVKQPLSEMGIREDVAIASLFPDPATTQAAANLIAGLGKTQDFCAKNLEKLSKPAVADIEADGAKLTSICSSQDWNAVSGEVTAAVNKRKLRAISNLEQVQEKTKSYTGVTASKADGEVEGVWKAVAIFGDTNFAKNYLSGWRFDGTNAAKGSNAGFMIELARALDTAREAARKLWEEAKEALAALEEEKVQVEEILEMARQHLAEMVKLYEEKEELARIAKDVLDKATERKIQVETEVSRLVAEKARLDGEVDTANENLKKTHDEALSSFMELLHASEQQKGTESWD